MKKLSWVSVRRIACVSLMASSGAALAASTSSDGGIERFAHKEATLSTWRVTPGDSAQELIPDQGYRVFGGIGLGLGTLSSSGFTNTPTGTNFLGQIGLGRRTGRWEWDGSLGWGFSTRNGIDDQGMAVGIKIRSARADFCARYRLWNGWAIGPLAAIQFGTDTRYTRTVGSSLVTPYIGSRTTIDFGTTGGVSVQLWGEALTQMSLKSQDTFAGMVGVRLGLPVDFSNQDSISLTRAAPEREVRIVLDGSKVFFGTNSSKIRPVFKESLSELSRYLASSAQAWDSVSIEGHADHRGDHAYNVRLSQKRAESVRLALVEAGISQERTLVDGYGPDRPVDRGRGRKAWARNRRVELTFHSVASPEKLRAILAPLAAENLQTKLNEVQ